MFTKKMMTRAILGVFALSSLASTVTLADDYMYVKATHLNVRASNTFRSSIIATVDNGYKVTVLESLNSGWKKVLLQNGEIGYMNGRYLSHEAPYYEKASGAYYTVDVPNAFVRADGLVRKIAVVQRGDTLEIMDEKVYLGKWLRVKVVASENEQYQGRVGYISKKLVRVNENTRYMTWSDPTTNSDAATVTATPVNDSWIADMPANVRYTPPANTQNTIPSTPNPPTPYSSQENILDDSPQAGMEEQSNDDIGDLLGDLLK